MRIDHCFLGDCRNSMREMLASGYAGKTRQRGLVLES